VPIYTTSTAGTSAWDYWTNNCTATTSTVWPMWVSTITAASTTTNGCGAWGSYTAIWRSWQTAWQNAPSTARRVEAPAIVRRYTPEEERQRAADADRRLQEANERAARYERELAEERARREEAEQKAYTLLMACLTPAQQKEYREKSRFTVHLPNGNAYQIYRGHAGNVVRIDAGKRDTQGEYKRLERFCIHAYPDTIDGGWMPDADHMLAQKIMLEADEGTFRRVANVSQYG
jgi:hypothetical protein